MPFFSNTTRSTTASTTNANDRVPKNTNNNKSVEAKTKADKEAEANVITSSLNAVTDVGTTKAVREFEHGRQRAKKSERTANYRAEKAFNKQLKAARHAVVPAPLLRQEKEKRAASGHGGARGTHNSSAVGRVDIVDLESSEDSSEEDYWFEGPVANKKSEEKVEIDLTALMQPAKARKIKAGDFEVVPSIRPVLALDDKFSVEALTDIDEPWECIEAEEDAGTVGAAPRNKTLSYADVLR